MLQDDDAAEENEKTKKIEIIKFQMFNMKNSVKRHTRLSNDHETLIFTHDS